MLPTRVAAAVVVAAALFSAPPAGAIDHRDGSAVLADPSTDLTDLFAWMAPDGKVNLVLGVFPSATTTSRFSNTARYVFHLGAHAAYASAMSATLDVICTFDAAAVQHVSCWAGAAEYATGAVGDVAGVMSSSGKLRVFAGLRDDPSAWNRAGFSSMASAVHNASPQAQFDAAGCIVVNSATSNALVGLLKSDGSGGPPRDAFAGQNVLAIVVSLDKSLLAAAPPILSVWASTRGAP